MKMKEINRLLQRYFNGESTGKEEQELIEYFSSEEKIAPELKPYREFFSGLSDLKKPEDVFFDGEAVMDHILEKESNDKSKYRWLWRTVTGIAASVILVVGGMLLFHQQEHPYNDTFDDPGKARTVAVNTLEYVSAKYQKGLAGLDHFDKLETASEPLKKGIKPVNDFFENVEKIKQQNSKP